MVGTASAVLFVALGMVAHRAHAGTAVDHDVLGAMLSERRSWLTPIVLFVTDVMGPDGMWPFAILVAVVLWWRLRNPLPALMIVGTLILTRIAITISKHVVGTRRPPHEVRLMVEESPSFPSGHSLTTLTVLGVLAVIIGYERTHRTRIWLWLAVMVATIAVALTRLYLGVHWLTDVTGGVLLGSTIVAVVGQLYVMCAARFLSTG